MVSASSRHAVLTGDMVDSVKMRASGAPSTGVLLRRAAAVAREVLPEAGISELDVFRGDSWQLLVRDPAEALAVAIVLRAALRSEGPRRQPFWDTRVAIGIGPAEGLVEERLSESEGGAFQNSGQALDRLSDGPASRQPRMTLAVTGGKSQEAAGDIVVRLVDVIVRQWTPHQGRAFCGSLRELTHAEIGKYFDPPISKQAVALHLERASEPAVRSACAWFRKAFDE